MSTRVVPILLTLVVSAAAAEDTVLSRALRSCAVDIDAYCAHVHPGGGRILGCLHAAGQSVSEACGTALDEVAAHLEEVERQIGETYDACEADRETYCPTARWGGGGVIKCLAMHSHTADSVSHGCRLVLEKHGVI